MSNSSAISRPAERRLSATRIGTAFAGILVVIASTVALDSGAAQADPIPDGCRLDSSVANQLTIDCDPGAGAGQHAYVRCTDNFGIEHTHIGPTIGAAGGRSTAVCGPGEIADM